MRRRLGVEFGSVERRSRGGWLASDGIVVGVLVVVVSRASIARERGGLERASERRREKERVREVRERERERERERGGERERVEGGGE